MNASTNQFHDSNNNYNLGGSGVRKGFVDKADFSTFIEELE
jgi:hypothetical protein